MENIFYIYTLINPNNNQVFYVGMSKDPHKRLIGHLSEAKKRKYIRHRYISDLLQLGIKPTINIVEKVIGDKWKERECFYIEYYKSLGYELVNAAPGGGVYPSWSGKHHSEETKKKISKANKGKPKSKHKRGKQKNTSKKPRWDKGLIGRNGNKVYKYGLDGKYLESYSSTNHASFENNISQSTVVRCCNNLIYRAKNFIFSYEYKPEGIEPFSYIHNVKVDCYTLDNKFIKQYNSLVDAGKDVNIHPMGISAMLNNKQKTAGGYIWKYAK